MKVGLVFGILCALVLHAGVLLFGGILFLGDEEDKVVVQEVELLSAEDVEDEKKPEVEPAPATEEAPQSETEQAPDADEIIRNLELTETVSGPELESLSLSAIEAALSGLTGGGGDFDQSVDFTSGGRIGASGKVGTVAEVLEKAFDVSEIDQEPRLVFQAAPNYPSQMRGKKVEGAVTVVFIVDPAGKVTSPKVETSNNAAFDKPALEAVKNSKFEPAIKAGKRVPWKMRVTVRFQPS